MTPKTIVKGLSMSDMIKERKGLELTIWYTQKKTIRKKGVFKLLNYASPMIRKAIILYPYTQGSAFTDTSGMGCLYMMRSSIESNNWLKTSIDPY